MSTVPALQTLSDFWVKSFHKRLSTQIFRTRGVLLFTGKQNNSNFPPLLVGWKDREERTGVVVMSNFCPGTNLTRGKSLSAQITGVEKHICVCSSHPGHCHSSLTTLCKVPLSGPWPDWALILRLSSHHFKIVSARNSLAVQWLGLWALTARGPGLIPGQGTKIPHATWCGQKKDF